MQSYSRKQYLRLIGTMIVLALLVGACVAPVATVPSPAAGVEQAGAAAESSGAESSDTESSDAETVTITHPQGETTVTKNPATVVVFDYSALDTLDQLGVPVVAVPKETLPPFLEKYRGDEYENAGTLFEPDYELVNQLQPDLIIAGGRSAGVYADLAKIAPTIDVTVDQTNFLESFKANVTNLGIIFGKEAEVAERLAAIDASIAEVQEAAAASGENALIVMTSGGQVTAYGPGSRFGIIHDLLGIAPVVEDIEAATHGDAISFEFILEHDPDILFILDRDSAIGQGTEAAEVVMDNELVHQTQAWANDRLVYLDSANWYLASYGLGTFAAMVGEIQAALE